MQPAQFFDTPPIYYRTFRTVKMPYTYLLTLNMEAALHIYFINIQNTVYSNFRFLFFLIVFPVRQQ